MNRQLSLDCKTPPRYRILAEISMTLAAVILTVLGGLAAFMEIPVRTAAASDDAEGFSKKIICTEEDFKKNSSKLLGESTIFSDKAVKLHQTDLVVGETYYLVIGVKLEWFTDFSLAEDEEKFDFYAWGALRFSAKNTEGIYDEASSVSCSLDADTVFTPDENTVFRKLEPTETAVDNFAIIQTTELVKGMHTLIAIPFVPLQEGVLSIECATRHNQDKEIVSSERYEDMNTYLTATVTATPKYLTEYGSAQISGMDFGIVDEWKFDPDAPVSLESYGNSKTYVATRRNYMIVEFDISRGTAQQTGCGAVLFADPDQGKENAENDLYFTIFLAKSKYWRDPKVEQANTGVTDIHETEDGAFVSFCYSLPESGTKHALIVISFEGMTTIPFGGDPGDFSVEMYLYSNNVELTGTTGLKETIVWNKAK